MSNQYLNHLLSDGFEKDALAEITRMLDEEIAKPATNRDYDKIKELTDTYTYISGKEEQAQEATKRGIQKLTEQTRTPRIRITKRLKIMIVAACAAAVLLAANAISVAAFHQDVFSVIIHYTKHGFSVESPDEKKVELPTIPDDPYGIKTECAKYGLTVEAPTYLPEGFELWNVEEHESSSEKQISFAFQKSKEHLTFTYAELYDTNAKAGIPSDHFNLEEIEVNGKPAITSKEDKQYTLIYYDGIMEYLMFSDCLAYEECDKIAASIQ